MSGLDSIWTATAESPLNALTNKVDSLQTRLDQLQEKTDMLSGIIETSNDSIANQLAASSNLLALVGLVIAVAGVILGIFISRKNKEMDEIAATVDEKKRLVDSVAETTKELDKTIKGNVGKLYKQLRDEETKTILDRLVLEPRDVGNLITLLLSRDLDERGYVKIKEAYLKLLNEEEEVVEEEPGIVRLKLHASSDEDYILLFFQHYCYQAVKDDEIRPALIKGFRENCQKAFKRDIIKTTIDLSKALSEEESTFNKEEVLTEFLKAVNHCKHKKLADLKNIFEQNIIPQSLLQKAIEKCKSEGVYLALFGIEKPEKGEEGKEEGK